MVPLFEGAVCGAEGVVGRAHRPERGQTGAVDGKGHDVIDRRMSGREADQDNEPGQGQRGAKDVEGTAERVTQDGPGHGGILTEEGLGNGNDIRATPGLTGLRRECYALCER